MERGREGGGGEGEGMKQSPSFRYTVHNTTCLNLAILVSIFSCKLKKLAITLGQLEKILVPQPSENYRYEPTLGTGGLYWHKFWHVRYIMA